MYFCECAFCEFDQSVEVPNCQGETLYNIMAVLWLYFHYISWLIIILMKAVDVTSQTLWGLIKMCLHVKMNVCLVLVMLPYLSKYNWSVEDIVKKKTLKMEKPFQKSKLLTIYLKCHFPFFKVIKRIFFDKVLKEYFFFF